MNSQKNWSKAKISAGFDLDDILQKSNISAKMVANSSLRARNPMTARLNTISITPANVNNSPSKDDLYEASVRSPVIMIQSLDD